MQAADRNVPLRTMPAVRLAVWGIGLAACWLGVLPWLSSHPAVDNHVRWLEERGIDPSAMYYTELEAMKPILSRLNRGRHFATSEAEPSAGVR
ncbi:MAG: hypothetical protein U0872_00445 [Planctomycetaceae bacterium]